MPRHLSTTAKARAIWWALTWGQRFGLTQGRLPRRRLNRAEREGYNGPALARALLMLARKGGACAS